MDTLTRIKDLAVKDLPHIMNAITTLGQVLVGLEGDFHDCTTGLTNDLHRISTWAAVFKDPKAAAGKIAGNVWAHLPEIYTDINTQMDDMAKNDWKDIGVEAANIMNLSLGPIPEATLF